MITPFTIVTFNPKLRYLHRQSPISSRQGKDLILSYEFHPRRFLDWRYLDDILRDVLRRNSITPQRHAATPTSPCRTYRKLELLTTSIAIAWSFDSTQHENEWSSGPTRMRIKHRGRWCETKAAEDGASAFVETPWTTRLWLIQMRQSWKKKRKWWG